MGKQHEARGLYSPEGELVPLLTSVRCAGAVEGWLLAVETSMCSTMAQLLWRCYGDMKKTKREKWIRDNGGQLTLTSGQIAWTVECTKALYAMADGHKMAMRQVWIPTTPPFTPPSPTPLSTPPPTPPFAPLFTPLFTPPFTPLR